MSFRSPLLARTRLFPTHLFGSLEGSIVMQLRGAEPVTLKAGEGFYEGPNDVHIVGRNASDSKPAKFVVFVVKKQGVPALLPAK